MILEELRVFVAAVDAGSLSGAATTIHRVQSSLSHRIKNLESRLDASLLERHAEGVTPTGQGLIVYDYSKRILSLVKECTENVSTNKIKSVVRLGIIECVPSTTVECIVDLNSENTYIDISMGSTGSILRLLEEGSLDMAIVASGFVSNRYVKNPLTTDSFALISGTSLLPTRDAAAFADSVFLVTNRQCSSIKNLEIFFEEFDIRPKRIIECGSHPILLSKIVGGMGAALVLKSSIRPETAGGIVLHNVSGNFSDFQYELVTHRESSNPALPSLRGLITALFNNGGLSRE